MSAIQIQGLRPLKGTVGIQGSKNAVLPMMAASLLADGVTVSTFENGAEIAARPVSFLDRFWRNGERR